LDVQAERIKAYCRAKGWRLTEVVKDAGLSAKDLKRPGLQAILAKAKRRKRRFDVIVVLKLDRLTRSVGDLDRLSKAFRSSGVGLTSITEAVDTTTATGTLFYNIVASISQWEREIIGERTKSALQHKKANGQRVSRWLPFGYSLAGDGIRLVEDPEERKVAIKIRDWRENGLSYRQIAGRLNAEGIQSKKGRGWHAKTVRGVVTRATM